MRLIIRDGKAVVQEKRLEPNRTSYENTDTGMVVCGIGTVRLELAGLETRSVGEVGSVTITRSCVAGDGKAVAQEK